MDNKNQEQQKVPAPKKYSSISKWLSAIALLIALIAIGAGYWLWQQTKNNQQQTNEQISQLQQELSHANNLLTQQQTTLKAVQETSQALQKEKSDKQSDYILLEVNYLVRLAAFHLMFENNTVLARQLLETADQRVASDETPNLWPLRKAFAADITMLNTAPTVDLPGVIARLGALSNQAEQLPETPIIAVKEKEEQVTAPATTQPPVSLLSSSWDKVKKFIAAVGRTLSDMVIISKDSKSIPSLLTAEERAYVITNIQSQLSLAEWAAVHRQVKVYQQSLSQVATWIERHFSTDNEMVKNMLQMVKDLQAVSVNPETPTISRSLEALDNLKNRS